MLTSTYTLGLESGLDGSHSWVTEKGERQRARDRWSLGEWHKIQHQQTYNEQWCKRVLAHHAGSKHSPSASTVHPLPSALTVLQVAKTSYILPTFYPLFLLFFWSFISFLFFSCPFFSFFRFLLYPSTFPATTEILRFSSAFVLAFPFSFPLCFSWIHFFFPHFPFCIM